KAEPTAGGPRHVAGIPRNAVRSAGAHGVEAENRDGGRIFGRFPLSSNGSTRRHILWPAIARRPALRTLASPHRRG
ncbi:MAG TPA: hypothetical protein VKB80_25505, partial [Kofleriaceae bacterium]|nr:hypothetical protein [Kofleriaceae bacterium]